MLKSEYDSQMNTARQAPSRMGLSARLWIVLAFTLLVGLAPLPSSPLVAQADAVESYPGKGFYVSSVYNSWEAYGTLCVTAQISSFSAGHTPPNREGAFYCYNDATTIWQPYLEADRGAGIQSIFGGDGNTYVVYNPSAGGTTIGRLGADGSVTVIGSMARCCSSNQVLSAVANDGFIYLQLYDVDAYRWVNTFWAVNIQTGSWTQVGDAGYLSTAILGYPTILGNRIFYLSRVGGGAGSTGGRLYSVTGTTIELVSSPTWAKAGYSWVEMRGLATDGRYLYPAAGYDYFDIGLLRYRWSAARYDTVTNQWVQTGGIPSDQYKADGVVSNGKIYLQVGDTLRVFEMASSSYQDFTGSSLIMNFVHRNRVITYPLTDYAWTRGWYAEAQTIEFAAVSDRVFGDEPFAISPGASSGLTVAISATPESVCRRTGTQIEIIGGGTCTLTASQAGDSLYLPATPIIRQFKVAPAVQTISWTAPASAMVGSNVVLAGVSSSGRQVGYASLTPNTCGIAGSVLIPLLRGTCRSPCDSVGDCRLCSTRASRRGH